jgi:cyclopropane fatty-acyl-phospholipid synthase-like methyltransferase
MNIYLEKFIKNKFKESGSALDLGAGDFYDINFLKKNSWKSEGVDIKLNVNLEEPFISKNKPFDLVFSNYVIHKIKNKKQFIKTIFDNLKQDGYFFIHTFDKKDENSHSSLTGSYLQKMLVNQGFRNIKVKTFNYYDEDKGHKHWHKILEATGQK